MARTEKVIMKNMCMVFSENRVLVQDKTDDDYSGITFPGGHVERGESFTDVKERYYNNKVAKIRKKLASLSTTVDKEDLSWMHEWTHRQGRARDGVSRNR